MYTFLVEDGTGVTDATSYATVAQADSFSTFWGYPDWDLLDTTAKENLLIRATRFMDEQFVWESKRLTETQGLSFPRYPFYDSEDRYVEGVPSDIIEAVSEIAILLENYSPDDLNNIKTLIRQRFGDSEDEYATPWQEITNPFVITYQRIAGRLKRYGYGGKQVSQVKIHRG